MPLLLIILIRKIHRWNSLRILISGNEVNREAENVVPFANYDNTTVVAKIKKSLEYDLEFRRIYLKE
jgi:hypothetical protein